MPCGNSQSQFSRRTVERQQLRVIEARVKANSMTLASQCLETLVA